MTDEARCTGCGLLVRPGVEAQVGCCVECIQRSTTTAEHPPTAFLVGYGWQKREEVHGGDPR